MSGACRDNGNRCGINFPNKFASIGHEVDHCCNVVAEHHTQVEAGRELALSAVQHDSVNAVIGLCLAERVGDSRNHCLRQRIGLAVVEMADQDAIASFRRDQRIAHAAKPTQ